jgi:hypothetical protein
MPIRKLLFAIVLTLATTLAAAPQTLTGVITDDMCGKKHTMMPGKPDAECVRACIKAGSHYALVVGDKVYALTGDTSKLDAFAAKTVQVTGEVKGNTVAVTSVAAAR